MLSSALATAEILVLRADIKSLDVGVIEAFQPAAIVIDPSVAIQMLRRSRERQPRCEFIVGRPAEAISTRLLDVAIMVHGGLTNKEIAQQVGVSVRTVKGYVSELLVRFDVTNRTELVGRLADLGFFSVLEFDPQSSETQE